MQIKPRYRDDDEATLTRTDTSDGRVTSSLQKKSYQEKQREQKREEEERELYNEGECQNQQGCQRLSARRDYKIK